MKGKLILP